MEALKKTCRTPAEVGAGLAPDTAVEVWFQDEMRVGQKNKLTYRCARRAHAPALRMINAPSPPTCSARSALSEELAPHSCFGLATAKPCSFTSTKSPPRWPRRAVSSLTKPAGMVPRTQDSHQHLAPANAPALTRTQQPREYLAIHAPELAVEPHL